jgi:hypothetical protein
MNWQAYHLWAAILGKFYFAVKLNRHTPCCEWEPVEQCLDGMRWKRGKVNRDSPSNFKQFGAWTKPEILLWTKHEIL